MINRLTGTEMWVTDERKDEYLAAGHKLAAEPCAKPSEVVDEAEPIKEEPKKATKRAPRKKK